MYLAIVPGARVKRGQLRGIRRPGERAERIVFALAAVLAQRHGGLFGAGRAEEHVVVLDNGFPFAVKRSAHLGRFHCLSRIVAHLDRAAARPAACAAAASSLPLAVGLRTHRAWLLT